MFGETRLLVVISIVLQVLSGISVAAWSSSDFTFRLVPLDSQLQAAVRKWRGATSAAWLVP